MARRRIQLEEIREIARYLAAKGEKKNFVLNTGSTGDLRSVVKPRRTTDEAGSVVFKFRGHILGGNQRRVNYNNQYETELKPLKSRTFWND